jgi:hypothetical protein
MGWVRVQVLMRPDHRNATSVEAAAEVAATLGLAPSGQGMASFSARVSAPDFRRLFKTSAAAGKAKKLAKGIGPEPVPLPVPAELAEYVESITVAPQHEYF